MDLLRDFAREESEEAFATLVHRHVSMVYATALRKTGNIHSAEEITQAVFIILARKASRLGSATVLPAWFHQTTRLTAANFLRGELRRVHREQELFMQAQDPETDPDRWRQLEPLLDDALGRLSEKDRTVIVMRFLAAQDFAAIGHAIHGSENAVKKRLARALERLRRVFARRGVTLTAGLIATGLATHSVQAAPALLANSISAAALAQSATTASAASLLANSTLKMLGWARLKIVGAAGAALLVAGTVASVSLTNGDYQIEGDLTCHNSPGNDFERHFKLTVKHENWSILITGQGPNQGIKYQEVSRVNGSVYRYDSAGIQGVFQQGFSGRQALKMFWLL